MTTQAMTGLGTVLAINPSGGSFVDIAEVYSITPPDETRPTYDATHYGSTAAEFIMGLPNFGDFVFEMNFVPGSSSEDLIVGLSPIVAVPIRVTWPNAIAWNFNGMRSGYVPAAPLNNRMTARVTFKVTGSVARGT